jgi:hypothetical protein
MLASSVLIGPWDYIVPTLKSYSELNQPLLVREYHSSNPRWILYRTYLLVPLAAGIAWIVTVSRRLDVVPTPQLIVGAAALAQMIVLGSMQFLGHWQTLEQSFYSSTLWGSVCLLLTIILTEIALPLFAHRLGRVLPVALLLAIPLLYEADPHVPALAWRPAGVCLAAGIVASAGVGRLLARVGHRLTSVALVACLVASAGCVLILTVAPSPPHTHLAGDAVGEPPPPYAARSAGAPAPGSINTKSPPSCRNSSATRPTGANSSSYGCPVRGPPCRRSPGSITPSSTAFPPAHLATPRPTLRC